MKWDDSFKETMSYFKSINSIQALDIVNNIIYDY